MYGAGVRGTALFQVRDNCTVHRDHDGAGGKARCVARECRKQHTMQDGSVASDVALPVTGQGASELQRRVGPSLSFWMLVPAAVASERETPFEKPAHEAPGKTAWARVGQKDERTDSTVAGRGRVVGRPPC